MKVMQVSVRDKKRLGYTRSRSDYFAAINDKAKAISAFEKSLRLNKLPETEKN